MVQLSIVELELASNDPRVDREKKKFKYKSVEKQCKTEKSKETCGRSENSQRVKMLEEEIIQLNKYFIVKVCKFKNYKYIQIIMYKSLNVLTNKYLKCMIIGMMFTF